MERVKNIAIIFAGGVGSRMGANIPKQFMKVYGKEIVIHTLERFQYNDNIDLIYVGCIEEYIHELELMVQKYHISKIPMDGIVPGGTSGQDTIYKILKKARQDNPGDSICLIHDGVRPLINDDVINANIKSVEEYGSAVTVTRAFETPILSVDGEEVSEVLERNLVYTAQAPQSFRLDEILNAHEKIRSTELGYNNSKIVDSCSLMKECGNSVHLVEGNRGNIKVTTLDDYIALLGNLEIDDYYQVFKLKNKE
jgi:2-C-methyl-D-erythritol 4-phosphate cytidylyltransferase